MEDTARTESLALEQPRVGIRRAIVLSGGGARGAYEAGVLRYLFETLPSRLGFVPRFDLYCGTSVGAVHACYLAAHADDMQAGVHGLLDIWKRMSFSTVYRFGLADALGFSRTLYEFLSGARVDTSKRPPRIHGLLNTSPLEQLVVKQIPWRRLRRNVHHGCVGALCVATTELATGRTVVFVDNRARMVPRWTRDPHVIARPARIGPNHALASAAIPVLFPAVRITRDYYCDGGLRQTTPLAPALRLGANRVLVVGLRMGTPVDDRIGGEREHQFLSAGFLFGQVLNALLADRIEYDLSHMRVLNRVLRAGAATFGPEYMERVNRQVQRERGIGFQIVDDCYVRPSESISAIAARHVHRVRRKPARTWIGSLAFRTLTRGSPEDEADLMSYLLFDGEYAADLIELGMADAARAEGDLLRFFGG